MSILAAEWGWTEADVNACAWHHVHKYLKAARKAKAQRELDQIVVNRVEGSALKELLAALNKILEPEKHPYIADAERLENMAKAADRFGQKDEARRYRKRASYLRTMERIGRDA